MDGMEETMDMEGDVALLDQLLAAQALQDLFIKRGLIDELKKALSARILSPKSSPGLCQVPRVLHWFRRNDQPGLRARHHVARDAEIPHKLYGINVLSDVV
ncbi:MAG: hypothetical protein ACK5X9_14085 [Alphaproteobacteria bacterium]|jgi:hypothetical protein